MSAATRLRGSITGQHVGALLAILALLGLNLLKDPGYLAISYNANTGGFVGNLVDIGRAVAPILMVSTGMCLVIATGGIDLSVGSMMAVSGAVTMEYLSGAAAPDSIGAAATAIGLMLLVCAALGLVNGVLIAYAGLQPFIATLVMMLAARGLAKVITNNANTQAENEPFEWLTNGYVLGIPAAILVSGGIAVAVAVVVRTSALGMLIESLGINAEASRLAGINRRAFLIVVYVMSAALAGVAGIFATGSVMTVNVSQTGQLLELDAILAVVIGGTSLAGGRFSLAGAAIGAVLIATLDKTIVFLGIPSASTPAFKAAVIIALYVGQSARFRTWVRSVRRRPSGAPAEVSVS
jgi:ribose/xylose/arabinose/galactoside ABC-type transport system permease subunit